MTATECRVVAPASVAAGFRSAGAVPNSTRLPAGVLVRHVTVAVCSVVCVRVVVVLVGALPGVRSLAPVGATWAALARAAVRASGALAPYVAL